jgi:exopolysaccharide biosynthesis polyprenyl glycosylphosphotransferase
MKYLIKISLILGDLLTWHIALALMLLIRYPSLDFESQWSAHWAPFFLLLVIWILSLMAGDLYQFQRFRAKREVWNRYLGAALSGLIISVLALYLLPNVFELTPKTNLFIVGALFILGSYGLRTLAWNLTRAGARKIFFLGTSLLSKELINFLKSNPQLGYSVVGSVNSEDSDWEEKINTAKTNLIVAQPNLKTEAAHRLYHLLARGAAVISFWDFYELVMEKVPLVELQEAWFLENIRTRKPAYDLTKRVADLVLSSIGMLILLPLSIFIAILIKIFSPGKIIYAQERTGLNNIGFTIYKFRTMKENQTGPLWTLENDNRITGLGKILRRTHLDEIPQLWNVLRGDISLLGPRAESTKLTEKFSEFPYYDMRHAIKPGISGWAQVNFQPSASLEEAKEKLAYDLYYIKNRSLVLDLSILIKTLRHLF